MPIKSLKGLAFRQCGKRLIAHYPCGSVAIKKWTAWKCALQGLKPSNLGGIVRHDESRALLQSFFQPCLESEPFFSGRISNAITQNATKNCLTIERTARIPESKVSQPLAETVAIERAKSQDLVKIVRK